MANTKNNIKWVSMGEGGQGGWKGVVLLRSHSDPGVWNGEYRIYLIPRPTYCDRGDWIINVDAVGDSRLDNADGFPRYFFGDAEAAKTQMKTWVSRREECQLEVRR